jgi:hypothetical protein
MTLFVRFWMGLKTVNLVIDLFIGQIVNIAMGLLVFQHNHSLISAARANVKENWRAKGELCEETGYPMDCVGSR